jgi:hypothetical protein
MLDYEDITHLKSTFKFRNFVCKDKSDIVAFIPCLDVNKHFRSFYHWEMSYIRSVIVCDIAWRFRSKKPTNKYREHEHCHMYTAVCKC